MIKFKKLLDSVSANGTSAPQKTENADKIVLSVHTAGNATATVKVVGGFRQDAPDFSSAVTKDNDFHYLGTIDTDGDVIAGGTGVAAAGTDIHEGLLVNIDKVQWIGVIVSGYSAGTVDVEAYLSNQNFM